MKKEKSLTQTKMGVFGAVFMVILFIYTVIFLVPLLWAFITSFNDAYAFGLNKLNLQIRFTFDNYIKSIDVVSIKNQASVFGGPAINKTYWELILTSLIYTVGASFCNTFIPLLVAYLTAKFKYKFSKLVYALVLIIMMIPLVGTMPSQLDIARKVGVYNSLWGMFVMASNFLGMYYLVFHAMFSEIPKDYAEAASIDGASNARIMFFIIFPMAKNTFLAVFLLRFIFYWNEYSTPMMFMPDYPVIALAMLNVSRASTADNGSVPMKMAASMLFCIPIFTIFMIFKDRIMGNVSMGGVKG